MTNLNSLEQAIAFRLRYAEQKPTNTLLLEYLYDLVLEVQELRQEVEYLTVRSSPLRNNAIGSSKTSLDAPERS